MDKYGMFHTTVTRKTRVPESLKNNLLSSETAKNKHSLPPSKNANWVSLGLSSLPSQGPSMPGGISSNARSQIAPLVSSTHTKPISKKRFQNPVHHQTLRTGERSKVIGSHNNSLPLKIPSLNATKPKENSEGNSTCHINKRLRTLIIGFCATIVLTIVIAIAVSMYFLSRKVAATTTATTRLLNTGNMTNARYQHTASVLNNGTVLVNGGWNDSSPINSAELYDPSTGIWTTTGNMIDARSRHTASILSNGKILVTGGYNGGALISVELYSPLTSTWTTTGNMNVGRNDHTASILSNGKILVTGGWGGGFASFTSTELYDPSTGTWTVTGNMNVARYQHTASILSNGTILVTGGFINCCNGGALTSAELYDSSTNTWTITGNMNVARGSHTASILSNEKILVTGGWSGNASLYSAELYDPSTGTWTVTGNMNVARNNHKASILSSGNVLVTGGSNGSVALTSVELYDQLTETWTTPGNMNNARYFHTASVLNNGTVLISGGRNDIASLNSAELY